jgi:hypothetical protein
MAFESMGRISHKRMPRLLAGAAACGPGAGAVRGACPARRLDNAGPSWPPIWSTCFWKWSRRRERFTAVRAR